MENKDQITTLNTLTATLIDSVNGYRDAAEQQPEGKVDDVIRQPHLSERHGTGEYDDGNARRQSQQSGLRRTTGPHRARREIGKKESDAKNDQAEHKLAGKNRKARDQIGEHSEPQLADRLNGSE